MKFEGNCKHFLGAFRFLSSLEMENMKNIITNFCPSMNDGWECVLHDDGAKSRSERMRKEKQAKCHPVG